jgi:hypothetical protein
MNRKESVELMVWQFVKFIDSDPEVKAAVVSQEVARTTEGSHAFIEINLIKAAEWHANKVAGTKSGDLAKWKEVRNAFAQKMRDLLEAMDERKS